MPARHQQDNVLEEHFRMYDGRKTNMNNLFEIVIQHQSWEKPIQSSKRKKMKNKIVFLVFILFQFPKIIDAQSFICNHTYYLDMDTSESEPRLTRDVQEFTRYDIDKNKQTITYINAGNILTLSIHKITINDNGFELDALDIIGNELYIVYDKDANIISAAAIIDDKYHIVMADILRISE